MSNTLTVPSLKAATRFSSAVHAIATRPFFGQSRYTANRLLKGDMIIKTLLQANARTIITVFPRTQLPCLRSKHSFFFFFLVSVFTCENNTFPLEKAVCKRLLSFPVRDRRKQRWREAPSLFPSVGRDCSSLFDLMRPCDSAYPLSNEGAETLPSANLSEP